MAKILVGLAVYQPDRRFLESLPVFFRQVRKTHEMEAKWVWNQQLFEAQNEIADYFLEGDHDYLLTIEDDHWGFTGEMLEALLSFDAPMVQMSYRNRHFPFDMIPMVFKDVNSEGHVLYTGMKETSGYHEADLCGFGFTLIKREVFDRLERPFFTRNCETIIGGGPVATDIDFCTKVKAEGMKIYGCFDYKVPHREITEDGRNNLLVKGILAKHSMYSRLHRMFNEQRDGRKQCQLKEQAEAQEQQLMAQ